MTEAAGNPGADPEIAWFESFIHATEDNLSSGEDDYIDGMISGIEGAAQTALALPPAPRRTRSGKLVSRVGARLFCKTGDVNAKYVSIPAVDARRLVHWYYSVREVLKEAYLKEAGVELPAGKPEDLPLWKGLALALLTSLLRRLLRKKKA